MPNLFSFEMPGEYSFDIPSTILDPSEFSIDSFNQLERFIEDIQISLYLSFCKVVFDRFKNIKFISKKKTFSDHRGLITNAALEDVDQVINNSKALLDATLRINPATLVKIFSCSDVTNKIGQLSITRENISQIGLKLLGHDWLSSYVNSDYEPMGMTIVSPDSNSVQMLKFPKIRMMTFDHFEIDWITQMEDMYDEIQLLSSRLESEYITSEVVNHLEEFPDDVITLNSLCTEYGGTLKASSVNSLNNKEFSNRVSKTLSSMHFSVNNPKYSHFIASSTSILESTDNVLNFWLRVKPRNGYVPESDKERLFALPGHEELELVQYSLYKLDLLQNSLTLHMLVGDRWIDERDEYQLNKMISRIKVG